MEKMNTGLIVVFLGASAGVGYFLHRLGYTQGYTEASDNCKSLLPLATTIPVPNATSGFRFRGPFPR